MNRNKWILTVLTVLLIGSTAVLLARIKSIQRLGEPGVKTHPIAGSQNLEVVLPETALDYTSEVIPQVDIVTNTLPKDTSYGQRRYTAPDKSWISANVVLMGADRGSLHKPQFCLTGAGWTITRTEIVPITIDKPAPYELPVIKLTAKTILKHEGREQPIGGIYVYWYVAEDAFSSSPSGFGRMWSMGYHLLKSGVLQRWAYISFFAPCDPGQEEAAFERVKKLIAATVPEFQIPHGNPKFAATVNPK